MHGAPKKVANVHSEKTVHTNAWIFRRLRIQKTFQRQERKTYRVDISTKYVLHDPQSNLREQKAGFKATWFHEQNPPTTHTQLPPWLNAYLNPNQCLANSDPQSPRFLRGEA